MKKILYSIWTAVILIIGLVFIQNQSLYLTKHSLSPLFFDIALPPFPNGVILLFFFFGGILLASSNGLVGRFRTRKALKRCNANGAGCIDKIRVLKNQLKQMNSRNTPKTLLKPSVMGQATGGDHEPA